VRLRFWRGIERYVKPHPPGRGVYLLVDWVGWLDCVEGASGPWNIGRKRPMDIGHGRRGIVDRAQAAHGEGASGPWTRAQAAHGDMGANGPA